MNFCKFSVTITLTMLSPEERAHDLATMVSHWQLEQIAKNAKEQNKQVKVNLHSLYHKFYTELLNVFKQDDLFNENISNDND